MNKQTYDQTDEQKKIEAAASKWVDLVLAHARAKKLTKPILDRKKSPKQMIYQNK